MKLKSKEAYEKHFGKTYDKNCSACIQERVKKIKQQEYLGLLFYVVFVCYVLAVIIHLRILT